MTTSTPSLEYDDIQGFVLRGFGRLPHAVYIFFSIKEKAAFQKWLSSSLDADETTPASHRNATGGCRQAIAFTSSGIQKLIGDDRVTNSFPSEFVEGIVQEHRHRLLGDTGPNAPEHWRWGNKNDLDGVVVIAAETQEQLKTAIGKNITTNNGIQVVLSQFAEIPADGREPFGFADGISQPIIAGTDRDKQMRSDNSREHKLHAVNAGEFILGYPDGTGKLPRSPALSPASDASCLLNPHHEQPELRDFGRNGSFLVVRQLAQDVEGFTKFIEDHSQDGLDLGAKMVGRTQEGATLATDTNAKSQNDFDYLDDFEGKGCPIGSHVRRSNPRSTVHSSSQEASLAVSNRHRIIRRGRVYKNADGETGLMFLCLNTSINRQFEFIQSTWCNNPFFQGLSGEVDPIIGTQRKTSNDFTIPCAPYRQKVKDIQQWVTVKGGGYFFLPGLKALKVLTQT